MLMRKKFKGRFLPSGIYLDRSRNYVFVRIKQNKKIFKTPIGRFDDREALSAAGGWLGDAK